VSIIFFLVELFAACLFCHSEAYRLRPESERQSTSFYLLFAAGGALGSFAVGILCPLIFSFNYDLALSFFVTAALAAVVTWRSGWGPRALWVTASILMLVLVFRIRRSYQWDSALAIRNFYGGLRVRQNYGHNGDMMRTLTNGTIQHGTQIFSAAMRKTPTSYYAEDSGIGVALRFCCEERKRNVGVVGLGAGTIAAYGRSGDRMRFYEINPAVRPVAENLFTYLRDSSAKITFAEGDARTSMEREAPQSFDVLVIDAFSGDAIPLHLLTTQAMRVYRKHLLPQGILAFHVSNQYVDLEPEILRLAQAEGMNAKTVWSAENEASGEFTATWVLVTADGNFFNLPQVRLSARTTHEIQGLRVWTDDYSSLDNLALVGATRGWAPNLREFQYSFKLFL
jgi:hypothetical protein